MGKKVIIDIEVKNNKAIQSTDKLKKSVEGVNKETKKGGEASKKAFGKLDGLTGGAISKFKGLTKSLGGVTGGFKALRVAVISSGIGALVIGVLALVQAFKRSEEGQNKFSKIMGVIGAVTGQLLDLIADLGEKIISVFENPKQAFQDFKKGLKENITNRIESLIDTFGFLGSAIKKVFSGDFKGALNDAKKAGSSYIDTMTGVKDSINKASKAVGDFVKETTKEAKTAAGIADKRAKATKLERKLTVERAKADQDIAELRFKSEQRDKFSAKERKDFLIAASKISEDIANEEIKAAKLRLDAQNAENALGKSTIEDKQKAADLEAKLIGLTTSKLALQKRLQTSITTFSNEEKAINKAKDDATAKSVKDTEIAEEKAEKARNELSIKQKKFNAEQIEDEVKRLEALRLVLEEESELETERLQKKIDNTKVGTQARVDAETELAKKTQEINMALVENTKATERAKRNEKAKSIRIEKLRTQQTLGDAKNTFNQVAQLAGEDSKIGKAMAIASATISGVEGVQNAYSTAQKSPITAFFPAYPIVQAGLAGAVAIKNISAIKSIKAGGTGGGGGSASVSAPAAQAPSFNVVGSSGSNQLAEAIGGQEKQPIKAFVVSSDVTTAQSLDRNIVSGASLG